MPRRKSDSSETPLTQATAVLNQYIDENRLRHTPERLSVLEAVLENGGRFTVDDIAATVEERRLNVCRSTVANTMQLLEKAGLVLRVGTNGRFVLYQKAPSISKKNAGKRFPLGITLQCSVCGTMKEVRDRAATAPLASRHYRAFTPTGGLVTIFGVCDRCSHSSSTDKNSRQ